MTAFTRALLLAALFASALPLHARSFRELQGDEQFDHGHYKLARALYREALRELPRIDRLWAKYDLAYARELAAEKPTSMTFTQLVPPTHARTADRRLKRTREVHLAHADGPSFGHKTLGLTAPIGAPIAPTGTTPTRIAALEPALDRDVPAETRNVPGPLPRVPGDAAETPATDDAADRAEIEATARAQDRTRQLNAVAEAARQSQAAQAAEILRLASPPEDERIPGGQPASESRIPGGQPQDETRVPGGAPRSQLAAATQSALAQGLQPETPQTGTNQPPATAAAPGVPDGTIALAPNEIVPVTPAVAGEALVASVAPNGQPLVVRGTGWDVWDLRFGIDLAGRPHVVGKLRNLSGLDMNNPTVYVALIDPAGVQVAFKPVKLVDPAAVLFPNASGEFDAEFPNQNGIIAGYRLYAMTP